MEIISYRSFFLQTSPKSLPILNMNPLKCSILICLSQNFNQPVCLVFALNPFSYLSHIFIIIILLTFDIENVEFFLIATLFLIILTVWVRSNFSTLTQISPGTSSRGTVNSSDLSIKIRIVLAYPFRIHYSVTVWFDLDARGLLTFATF